ncbi:nucleoprotein TPR-like isoform X7 [Rhodnius prolixus]|uniref:nucleoprotein TPR-like isoform X7 n=1 Tax=Rhodnius prolixus TaxID=13249 RepID=UPI003D18A5AE
MANEAKTLLLKGITETEYSRIEEPVRNKIESVLNEQIQDFLSAKIYFETTRGSQEVKVKDLEEHLRTAVQEKDEIKIKFDVLQSQFDETNKTLSTVRNQLNSIRDEVQRLEKLADNLRRERNEATDEKQTAANQLVRRHAEIDRLKIDIDALNAELKASLQAKCEAVAAAEDIQSKQTELAHKEKLLENERILISKQIVDLNAELFQANNALSKQRREATNEAIKLQTTISEKEEELRIIKEQNVKLQDQNIEIGEKLALLTERLKEQKAEEKKIQDELHQQLNAQTSLADNYKERLAESEAHSAELGGAVRELQRLLQEATSQYSDLESRLNQNEQEAANTLQANQESIKALKEELKHANLLLEAVKQESSEAAVSRLSPMAASASKLLKSGLTLTQLYTKFAEVTRELIVEKNEKEAFKKEMEILRKELEEKVPLIQKQKQEYEYTLSSLETLKVKVNQLEEENAKLKATSSEAEAMVERLTQYNKRFNDTIKDLSRQICYLLRELETVRGNGQSALTDIPPEVRRAELKTSPDVISKSMVTFRGVEELKLLNLGLLVTLMEQLDSVKGGSRMNAMSNVTEEVNELEVLKKYLVKFENVEQLQLINLQMLASLKELSAEREREEKERERRNAEGEDTKDNYKLKELQDEVSRLETKVEDLLDREKFLMKQIEVIKNQRDVYHKLFLGQSKGSPSAEVPIELHNAEEMDESSKKGENAGNKAEIRKSNDSSEAAQSRRLTEELHKEFEIYRQERSANEKLLVETIAKLRTDLGNAVKERAELASRAEYNQATCDRLKSRLKALDLERISLEERCSNYSTVISNLEGSLQKARHEVMDLLNKLSITEVVLANLKEENAFLKQRENRLLKDLEFQKKEKHGQELLMANLDALKIKFECTETQAKLKLESQLKQVNNECSGLKRKLQEEQEKMNSQIELLEKQTTTAKQRLKEEQDLRQKTNDQLLKCRIELKERDQSIETLTQQLKVSINQSQPVLERENKIRELEMLSKEKDNAIKHLEEQITVNKTYTTEVSETLQRTEKQLVEMKQKFESYKKSSEKKVSELQGIENELRNSIRILEAKLKTISANEVEERAARDVQLSNLKNRMESLGSVLNDAKERAVKAESEAKEAAVGTRTAEDRAEQLTFENQKLIQDIEEIRSNLLSVKSELETAKLENSQLQEKITDLSKVNDLLHTQFQELGAKAAEGANPSTNDTEDSQKGTEKLLEVLRIMKKEKNVADDEIGNLRNAKIQLESEVRMLKSDINEMEKKVQEGETALELRTEISNKTEAVNQLSKNNDILKREKECLENKLFTIEQQLFNIESEVVQPSKSKITELESTIERLSAENKALKEESHRWPYQAGNQEEVKRLTKEKENLSSQLTREKEQSQVVKNKSEEQLAQLRSAKEEATSSLSVVEKNLATLRQELNETKDNLKEATNKLSNMELELATKDINLNDLRNKEVQIRQIAKKYKAQFQELTKTLTDERKLKDGTGSSTNSMAEEKLKNLTEQVITVQRENEALQRENDSLKAGTLEREDRAKTLLRNARNRIQQLTDENKALKEFGDFRGSRSKGEGSSSLTENKSLESRISKLEKEKEGDQLEKERLLRELEATTQRLSAVQRQLEKHQASKPTTSSGERSSTTERSSDPPTANIKPMAGPSTSTNKLAQTGEVGMENNGVVSASNQEQVSEHSVSASNHGSGPPQSDYYRVDNGTDGVAASESTSCASGGAGVSGLAIAGSSDGSTATSQQAASSTTSVTTSVAHQSPAKRPHHHADHKKHMPPMKRSRMATVGESGSGEMLLRSDGLEVEYQVPTSSQRDQEDEALASSDVDESPKALDGQDFEEEGEEESRYELDPYERDTQDLIYHHEEVQESEMHMLDEASSMDQDNNEVEILDVGSEVPNQCESSAHMDANSGSSRSNIVHNVEEARISGASRSNTGRTAEAMPSSLSQVTSNQSRRPTTMPALNRHHISLSYDEPGDDSIVPSTPTLFVPRRSDGFCETVSSPQVPSVRFTFAQDHPSNNMSSTQAVSTVTAGVAQVASEGMDDTRMDLSQLDDGTGRTVPTTPSHGSSQESTVGSESGRIDDLSTAASSIDTDSLTATVPDTPADEQNKEGEKASSAADVTGTPGTSSSSNTAGGSGRDSLLEEGREAEAITATQSTSSTSKTSPAAKNKGGNRKTANSARRTVRVSSNRGNNTRTRQQPSPIIWPLLELQQAAVQQSISMLPLRGLRSRLGRAASSLGIERGAYRARSRRGARGGYHSGGNFQNPPRDESDQNSKNTRSRRKQ